MRERTHERRHHVASHSPHSRPFPEQQPMDRIRQPRAGERVHVVAAGRAELGADAAGMRRQQQDAASDADRLLDRVGDEQHGEPRLLPQAEQFVLHLAPRERVERGERLVHQEDRGLHRHAAGDGDARLHAAGEHVRIDVGEAAEPDLVDRVPRFLLRFPRAEAGAVGEREHDVLLDGLPGEQLVELLEHHHPVGSRPHDLAAVERDAALGRADVAADRLEQGRFPAAGRPEQHVTVGALDREVDAIGRGDEGVRRLVLQGHAVDLEEWLRGCRTAAVICPRRRGREANGTLLDIGFLAC